MVGEVVDAGVEGEFLEEELLLLEVDGEGEGRVDWLEVGGEGGKRGRGRRRLGQQTPYYTSTHTDSAP